MLNKLVLNANLKLVKNTIAGEETKMSERKKHSNTFNLWTSNIKNKGFNIIPTKRRPYKEVKKSYILLPLTHCPQKTVYSCHS